eukprot:scaffold1533_cov254-Pinguiococcus_pyrenoidosus.AAC.2
MRITPPDNAFDEPLDARRGPPLPPKFPWPPAKFKEPPRVALDPDTIETEPEAPVSVFPLDTKRLPEASPLDAPVTTCTEPLAAGALLEATFTPPEAPSPLIPLLMATCPPVAPLRWVSPATTMIDPPPSEARAEFSRNSALPPASEDTPAVMLTDPPIPSLPPPPLMTEAPPSNPSPAFIVTLPPIPCEAVPAWTLASPPAPPSSPLPPVTEAAPPDSLPNPADICTAPATPRTELPLVIAIEPECLVDDAPVEIPTEPLSKDEGAVERIRAPEAPSELVPLVMKRLPPRLDPAEEPPESRTFPPVLPVPPATSVEPPALLPSPPRRREKPPSSPSLAPPVTELPPPFPPILPPPP